MWKTSLLLECSFLRDRSFVLNHGNRGDDVNSINEIISYVLFVF